VFAVQEFEDKWGQ